MDVDENSRDVGETNVGGIVWWRKKICSFTILCMFVKTDIQIYVSWLFHRNHYCRQGWGGSRV